MKKVFLSIFIVLIFALSFGTVSSFAAEGGYMEIEKDDVAIDGYCPVCIANGKYMKGNPKFSTEYNGKIYYFPGFDQQKMFINDPEAYLAGLEAKYKQLKEQSKGSDMQKGSYNKGS